MFIFEKCYDLNELANRNMHVHTYFSGCAKPEMQLDAIFDACNRCGLTHIALTDHSGIEADGNLSPITEHNSILKARRRELKPACTVLIGSELSLYGIGKLAATPEMLENAEYKLIAQNHYHLRTWEQPEDKSPRGYAEDMMASLKWLFANGSADCIAHPLVPIKTRDFPDAEKIPGTFTDNDLGDLMAAGEASGCAWELHWGAIVGFPEFARRYFNIGREVGVHFNVGTDAHTIVSLDPHQALPMIQKILL